jgi:GNAT superfamily N-acetyltransferase
MPDPIPIVVLGRLAVDRQRHGRGMGRGLIADAAMRVVQASEAIGVRGLLVRAVDESASRFYQACGFTASPRDPRLLMAMLQDVVATLRR